MFVRKVCGCALSARGVTGNGPFVTSCYMCMPSPFHLPSCGIQGRDIVLWRSICSRIHVLMHSVQRQDCHEPVMVVVCHSEFIIVLPPIVDRSILMCNRCLCMHLCRLYLDCVVCNKNGNVCLCSKTNLVKGGKYVPLIS